MDDSTDLSRPAGWSDGDDDAARRLRAALGEHVDPRPGERAPREVLARLERRAVRHHRRRQAVALGGAAAAAAVVVAVGGLVLPQLSLPMTSGADSSAAGSAAGADSAGEAASAPQAARSDEAYGGGSADQETSTLSLAGAASPVSAASMLTAADVRAFSDVPVQEEAAFDETGQALPLSACVGGDAGSLQPTSMWRVDLLSDPQATTSTEPPGLVERVARLGSPAEVTQALAAVEAQVPSCAGAGLEGTGPTTQLDATGVTPTGGDAVALASTSGQGAPTLTLYLAGGETLVVLQVTSNADTAELALADMVDTARTAVERATDGQVSIPAGTG